jgi:hypothetical protein
MNKTYRIRVTEYNDIEAATAEQAVAKFHDKLLQRINMGGALDTKVTLVAEIDDGEETERSAEDRPDSAAALPEKYECALCGKKSASSSWVEPCPKRDHGFRHVWRLRPGMEFK